MQTFKRTINIDTNKLVYVTASIQAANSQLATIKSASNEEVYRVSGSSIGTRGDLTKKPSAAWKTAKSGKFKSGCYTITIKGRKLLDNVSCPATLSICGVPVIKSYSFAVEDWTDDDYNDLLLSITVFDPNTNCNVITDPITATSGGFSLGSSRLVSAVAAVQPTSPQRVRVKQGNRTWFEANGQNSDQFDLTELTSSAFLSRSGNYVAQMPGAIKKVGPIQLKNGSKTPLITNYLFAGESTGDNKFNDTLLCLTQFRHQG